ncbi:MAG: GTPase HflX [Bacteriovoracaceae bacterium]|jgi:GTPase|nr:GTPase HflX [Bacteriovoracaceae bacterium]
MFDSEFHISPEAKAGLISMVCPNLAEHETTFKTERSLHELDELLRTLGIERGSKYIQNRKNVDAGSILGKGKLEEIAASAKKEGVSLLVFDIELTASQIRNIKKITGLSVVDRVHIILEIFAHHAQTNESKVQIEIARLQYVLPRLAGFWTHLGRQRGGIGVKGGEGEQQIELDRRIIRSRIEFLRKELKTVEKSRVEQRKKRQNKAVTAALVGYTNAGKSSLMNRLCRVDILEENKLFATLDSTFRTLNPDTHPPMILIDTVGFISNLPSTLIDGFKTTLESAMEADLLILVCDISDLNFENHLKVTYDVLRELKIEEKEILIVFNKLDLLDDPLRAKIIKRTHPNSFLVSSFNPHDIDFLRKHIINYFLEKQDIYDLYVPYEHGHIHSSIISKTNVMTTNNHEAGIYYKIRVPDFIFSTLGIKEFVLAPDDPRLDKLK